MKEEVKENLHEGHRARAMEQFGRLDVLEMTEHQVLEILLFYIFPRIDTNELAHKLLNRFGSFSNVLDADIDDMITIPGVNIRTARMLTYIPKFFDFYTNSKLLKGDVIKDWQDLYYRCESFLRMETVENLYIMGFSIKRKLLGTRKISVGNGMHVDLRTREISKFVNSAKPAYLVISHNHPGGSCIPSQADLDSTETVKAFAQMLGVGFIDHIVIGEDGVYSIENKKQVVTYNY